MVEILEETKKYVVFKVPASKKLAVIRSLIPEVKLSDKENRRIKKLIATNKNKKSYSLAEVKKKLGIK